MLAVTSNVDTFTIYKQNVPVFTFSRIRISNIKHKYLSLIWSAFALFVVVYLVLTIPTIIIVIIVVVITIESYKQNMHAQTHRDII